MKKIVRTFLAAAVLLASCATAWTGQPTMNRKGYTLWRTQRKLPANLNAYRKYRNDKAWHNRMHRYYRPQEFLLNTFDWTTEELAFFMQKHHELFKFHPAGYED